MTYRVYIKKDYKPEVAWIDERRNRSYFLFFSFLCVVAISTSAYFLLDRLQPGPTAPLETARDPIQPEVEAMAFVPAIPKEIIAADATLDSPPQALPVAYYEPGINDTLDAESQEILDEIIDASVAPLTADIELDVIGETNQASKTWQTVTVKSGDSMALIFSRLGLSPRELYNVMSLGKDVARLKRIKPGQLLHFHIIDGKLHGFEYELDMTNTLSIVLEDNQFKANVVKHELDAVVKNASAVIEDSLFLAGKRAGLSDNLIMQMVGIYGWDIDFALDIRKGDTFTLIYEEKYKNGEKVADGPILAAEFTNRGQPIRAIRFTMMTMAMRCARPS